MQGTVYVLSSFCHPHSVLKPRPSRFQRKTVAQWSFGSCIRSLLTSIVKYELKLLCCSSSRSVLTRWIFLWWLQALSAMSHWNIPARSWASVLLPLRRRSDDKTQQYVLVSGLWDQRWDQELVNSTALMEKLLRGVSVRAGLPRILSSSSPIVVGPGMAAVKLCKASIIFTTDFYTRLEERLRDARKLVSEVTDWGEFNIKTVRRRYPNRKFGPVYCIDVLGLSSDFKLWRRELQLWSVNKKIFFHVNNG